MLERGYIFKKLVILSQLNVNNHRKTRYEVINSFIFTVLKPYYIMTIHSKNIELKVTMRIVVSVC